jgi:hypothetical protein
MPQNLGEPLGILNRTDLSDLGPGNYLHLLHNL